MDKFQGVGCMGFLCVVVVGFFCLFVLLGLGGGVIFIFIFIFNVFLNAPFPE